MSKALFKDFDLAYAPGPLLRRCHQRSHRLYNEIMGGFDLTRQQTAFLILLYQNPGASLQQLADLSWIDRNTLAGIANRLEARGLVEKRSSKLDTRACELNISKSGIALLKKVEKHAYEVQEAILAPLSEKERKAFIRYARKLAELD